MKICCFTLLVNYFYVLGSFYSVDNIRIAEQLLFKDTVSCFLLNQLWCASKSYLTAEILVFGAGTNRGGAGGILPKATARRRSDGQLPLVITKILSLFCVVVFEKKII